MLELRDREALHGAVITGQRAAVTGQATPMPDWFACLMYDVLGEDVDAIVTEFMDRARKHVPEIVDDTGGYHDDLFGDVLELSNRLVWFALTAGWMRVTGGTIGIPRRLMGCDVA
jgi:hypothetical protein